MSLNNWDEFRTAYQVARLGTVSAAADVLGVHHATVIRHVDALEGRLGVKLFQRHARGYTATEAGEDLLKVTAATEDQFNQLVGRLKGGRQEISGELNITTISSVYELIVPALSHFHSAHPAVQINYFSDERLFRLEYGEAHIAVRAGPRPAEPDNVVQPLGSLKVRLVASNSYVQARGCPRGPDDFEGHSFVAANRGARPPFAQWLEQHIDSSQIILRATEFRAAQQAVIAGMGVGFVSGNLDLSENSLTEIMQPLDTWNSSLWLVTHVDLHRTPKVQAALEYLKVAGKYLP